MFTENLSRMLIGGKVGDRKPLTDRQIKNRASRSRIARANRKVNRTSKAEKRKRARQKRKGWA